MPSGTNNKKDITLGANTDLCLCWLALSIHDSCTFFNFCQFGFLQEMWVFSFLRPSLYSTIVLWGLEKLSVWPHAFGFLQRAGGGCICRVLVLGWVFCSPIKNFSGLVIFKIFYNPSVSYPSSSFFWTMLTVCQTNLAQTFARLEFVAMCKYSSLCAWAFFSQER